MRKIDWPSVRKVLVVRLRSIGDTVLSTPSLIALRRFLPEAHIDVLLEDWVAPVLDGFDAIDRIIIAGKTSAERIGTIRELRRQRYDIAFNFHGGTTSGFLVFASGARHRIGYQEHRYSFLLSDRLSSSSEFWGREKTHSAEQQLALLGFVGVPVEDRPRSRLAVTEKASSSLQVKLNSIDFKMDGPFAVIHPLAAFASKQWAPGKFAEVINYLHGLGIKAIAVGSKSEADELEALRTLCRKPFWVSGDIDLPETTALLSNANLFVGNDSGIAHMAAAVGIPTVVIFGSMNRDHWYPWTDAPAEMVFEALPCQPCPGYECKVFGDPKCILAVPVENVTAAIDRVLNSPSPPFS
ncbi:MAG: glycosyltransferase family 9 protein [Pyrinomonadaceae bacterium]